MTRLVNLGALVVCLAVLLLLSERTGKLRTLKADVALALEGPHRYVDMGVVLRVVRQDPAGVVLLTGKPPLVVLREHRRGGIVDTAATPARYVGPSMAPVIWYCSEQAEPLILHAEGMPLRLLTYGAMGAGKTTTMVQWLAFRALEFTGLRGELGATAPTNDRSIMIELAIRDLWPASWWQWKERNRTFTLANGITVRLVSTHQQSSAEGSRVQGWNWIAAASDEVQDSLAVDGDIEARGRDAPMGRYLRFNTATAKDDSEWRTWRDRVIATSVWGEYRMSGPDSPFTWPDYWRQLAETLTPREYERKVLALDVGPERMVYGTWSRKENVRPVPQIGAVDCTREVLQPYGPLFSVLVGHDPGKLCDVSLILKAYRLPNQRRHVWFVVDELTTEGGTEAHAVKLIAELRRKWGVHRTDVRGRPLDGSELALVRADPYTNSDQGPNKATYVVLQNHGLHVRPASYAPTTQNRGGTIGAVKPGHIPKEEGIQMVIRLLCDATGERRLFVACDEYRTPVAPRLVDAFERSERDAAGEAETERKNLRDRSHWPSCLRWGLWSLERPRYSEVAV